MVYDCVKTWFFDDHSTIITTNSNNDSNMISKYGYNHESYCYHCPSNNNHSN